LGVKVAIGDAKGLGASTSLGGKVATFLGLDVFNDAGSEVEADEGRVCAKLGVLTD
jgi:hypothetical protein